MGPVIDFYCCQGGASVGYQWAGFSVVGVDIDPQPRYPFPFLQMNALEALTRLIAGETLEFIQQSNGATVALDITDLLAAAASPPCQAKTKAQKIMSREHPRLIGPTRDLLIETGLPYVIENVVPEDPGTDPDPLIDPVLLCGAMFPGLGTYRHRLFESNFPIDVPDHPEHVIRNTKMGRPPVAGEFMHVVGNFSGVEQAKAAMGIDWMTRDGLRESIPPAYTEFIGRQLMAQLGEVAA
jgi:DNA (cytosine-5)-methyltransferase 1